MIAINSNCSRVDLVKAQAGQLKIQAAAASATGPAAPAVRKVKTDLQTLDTQIKTGDAKKAEQALATTERDVQAAQDGAAARLRGPDFAVRRRVRRFGCLRLVGHF